MQKAQVIQSLRDHVATGGVGDLALHDTLVYIAEYIELHSPEDGFSLPDAVLQACQALPKAKTRAASNAISMFGDDMVGEDVPPNPTDLRVLYSLTGGIFMERLAHQLVVATGVSGYALDAALLTEKRQVVEKFRDSYGLFLALVGKSPKLTWLATGSFEVGYGRNAQTAQVLFRHCSFFHDLVFTGAALDEQGTTFRLTSARVSLKEALRMIEVVSREAAADE